MAHLLGRNVGDVTFNFADPIILQNEGARSRTATISVNVQGYSEVVTQRVEIPAQSSYQAAPMNPTFNFNVLYDVTTPVSANLAIEVFEGNDLVDLHNWTLKIQPVNRFQWFWETEGGYADMGSLIATMITPEDRERRVESLLTEAARYTSTGSIHGYQGNEVYDAIDQAAGVYYALQERGIVYTDVSGSFFDGAQNVKTPAESLATGSSNCVDGMLVFASAFEAMGMDALLFFVRGHAFVGVRLSRGGEDWIPIETTMVGYAGFADAVEQGFVNFQNAVDNNDPYLEVLELRHLRNIGILPANL